MQSLSAVVRFLCLPLVADATPADPPGSIVILEPGENSFTIGWSAGVSNDCSFQAWQVQVRSRNLNGTLVGSWREPACEVPTSRDYPNCTVDGLQRNSPYDLQIFERCANGADDSSAGEAEQVLWTLPGYWEIHIPPHDASSYVVEDTLEAHAGCEVIKSCCDDQFSLCFSGNESRTVEVQRVDTELGWWQQVGWGQDLYLRCHAPSVAAFKNDPISKELPEPPWYLRLYEPTHVTAQVVFHHGNFIGGCQCANHQLQTRPSGSSTWRNESGDCLVRDSRHCNIQELQANARIYGRMQTTCLDESMNSNWSDVVEVITRPACTWTYDSSIQGAAANELECVDKTFCDFDADPSCCSSAGGRLRCPQNYPVMCENQDCVGSTDYCCVSTEAECGSYGGVRFCSASMVPAEVPHFEDFNSYLASSLRITWSRGIYLSEDDSPCEFSTWHLEVAETYDDGSNGSWVLMSNCATLAAEATICEVGPDQGLISLQKYVVRMKEICTDAKLNSEFSYAASIATTWPMRAYPVSNITFTNIRDDAATISWLPGVAYERHVQECDFHHWEVMIRMASRYVQGGRAFGAISWDAEPPERDDLYLEYEEGTDWYLGCRSFTRDQSNCDPGSLESDRDYAVMVRERCLDSNADGDYVKSSSLLRTAAAAAHAPVNFTTSEIRKYRYDLSWDPGDRRACVFWAWQVMTKPVGVDWPPEEQDNASIAGGDHFFIYSRNITEARFKLPLGSNTQYGARVRERCTKPEFDGEWEYLLYPGVWTAPPVQAERLSNVTFLFNWPALLSIRFFAGPEGWLEDLDPGEEGYNSHSDCEFQGWYVEVADTSTPDSWLVQQECLVLPRSFEGCDIYSGLEYGKEYHLRLREGCTDPSARSPEYLTTVTARDRTPAAVPFDVKKNSDTAFSYEFSWEPGTSYDCVFLRWEVQLRSVNDTNSSAAAYGDGKIEDIRSRIYGHSQNPGGVSSSDWSVPVEACTLPTNRELAWCRIEPLLPNAFIDLRVREICEDSALYSPYAVLETISPEAPATQFTAAAFVAASDEGNSLQMQFSGANVGDCLDALPQIEVKAKGDQLWTRITEVSYVLSQNPPHEPHDLISGVITALGLQPNTLYFGQVRLYCPSGSHKDGPFFEAQQSLPTMPGCKWSRHSNRTQMAECSDGSFCNFTADESCCTSLQRCPPERPWLCDSGSCQVDCASFGGDRSCTPSEWPANMPQIYEANSFSPATLTLSWGPQTYLSGNVSSCTFSRWDLQLAKVAADGSLETWVPLTHCFYNGSREQQHSCQVDDLDFLQYYQVRFAELCEDSTLDSLYNWTHPILIRGALAGSPVNITMTVLSQSDIHIGWDASTAASDCSFYAWEVQWRLSSSVDWTTAAECQDLIYRNQTECIIRELSAMASYVVRITESCTDARTNSLPADTPTFRFREVDDWEIYLGPSAGMTLAVSTLSKEVDHCEVITTCCDDQFSICYSSTSTEQLAASVSRTDFVAGWGQQLWLRCFANGVNPLGEELPSAAPAWIELQNPSRSGMSASYSLGQAPGHCLCAHPHLQLKAANTDTAWVSYAGDCADMSLRACSLTDLVPDGIYIARLQVACANSSMNSPWTYSVEATTDPGCKWSSSSGNGTGYECKDGSFCASPGCCSGNLLRCPDVMPIMCSDSSCSGDHCCVSSSSGCAAKGGVRSCDDTMVPAKEPTIQSVVSPSPSSLLVTWAAGSYASGFTSPCAQGGVSEFVRWALEISQAEADEWRSVSCDTSTSRSSTSCGIDQLMPNTAYQVRLAEICLDHDLDSDYTVSSVAVTLPTPADSPSELSMELSGDMLNVTWTPGASAGHCVFQSWEIQWRWSDSSWTSKTCGFLRSSSECLLDRPLETIELRVRERCQDSNADSAFLLSAPFKWSSVEDWQVYVGSSSSSALAVDVLTVPVDVTTSAGTAIFSLCFGTSQVVTVTRTDALNGWSEELWLHCSLRSSVAVWSAPSAPSTLGLVPRMDALKGASLDASFEAVSNLGSGCKCGRFELELQAVNYSTPSGYAQQSQIEKPLGCSSVSLASRSCSAESLRSDAHYQAFLRVQCDEGGSNYKSGSFVTPPACKWVTDSGYADLYECVDGLLCNSTSCCNGHGGRARCPQAMPVMCAKNLDCANGQDRCCMASEAECASHSDVRPCYYAEIPAKAPVINQVLSPAPGELLVQWQHASYLNGDRSRCSFTSWRVEVTEDPWSDGEAEWQLASECSDQDRPVTSCLLQNLVSNSNYSVRLREACTRMDYDSDWALWPSAFTLPTPAAAPTASCVEPAAKQGETMRMQVSWTPGAPGDCSFEAWEIYMQLLPNSMTSPSASAWMLACRSNLLEETSCYVDSLLSGRYYALRIRQVCVNPAASSVYAELTGTECLVTAMPASSPVNLTAVSLSPYDVDVNWAAMHPWACSFYAWQVQVKAQAEDNWEASGFGCFSYDRDVGNCTVNVGLGSNTPYDVRVRETCLESTLNSSWLQLAFPGVSTPLPVTAATPTALTVSKVSAFELRATWQSGSAGDCAFSSWEVLILYPDSVTSEALHCPSMRGVGQCDVSLRTLTLTAAGSYGLQVREICSDPLANSDPVRQDAALQLGERPASISDLALQDAGETWMLFTWVSGLSSCSSPQYQIHWRQLNFQSWTLVLCQALPCNVTGLATNLAYEVLVEEACESPWSIPTIENESSTFWTMPGEWSLFIGSSHTMTVSVMLTETPHRCYVQKECCADEFAICHDTADSRSVQLMRVDVPGGWGQRLTLVCVQPVLSTISLRPEVQVTGPESLLLAPRDNQSVTVVYPLRMAASVEGCECPEIVLEMATQGTNSWLPRTGEGGLCKEWSSRECVVDGLVPGTTYEGRVQISCQASALSSIWTYAGATVTTNLEALVVEGSISVTAARRLSAGRRLAEQQLQKVLSEVTGVELRSVMVTTEGSDMSYLVAASTLGSDDAESAELEATAAQRRLEDSFATDFSDRLSSELGSSVQVKVVLPPDVARRSEAFSSCGLPPTVANSARNWSSTSCLGRTWSDGPCEVPCDVGFLPEGGGFLCSLDGEWSSAPRCASIWSVGDWGTCQGVADDCGDGGMQQRQVTCPEASGCHAMSKPVEEQSCRATSGCLWVEGAWSTCSNDCGVGERSRSITCSSPVVSDCADKAVPANSESCSDYSNCQWQIQTWSLCSSSCGVGTQTREVTCEADPHCPSPSPALVQYCYETASCTWQTSSWSACSNTCGAGTAERQVWCSSGTPEDCAGAMPAATQSCYETVGCTWQKGSWSSCSSTCGPGQRQRDVTCPSGQAADCPGTMPAIEEDCYETNGCVWVTQSWENCDNRCGSGTRTRAVYCSVMQLDADCSAAGAKPLALEGCYDVVGCAWLEGTWSACSATCGAGLRSRSVSCPSGWPADCAQFEVEPVSTETCRGSSTCEWRIGDWSSCSNDCGDGTMVRSVQCSSGEDMDCTAEKPVTSQSCRVTSGCGWSISAWSACDATCGAGVQRRSAVCDSGLPEDCTSQPVVVQSCYATSGCSWLQGDWSSCSSSCGLGLRQRSVTCSSGEDSDCVAGERPSSSEACYELSGCSWQTSSWSGCSATCGLGLRTRQVWCDSLVDADCQGNEMPVRSESCYNTSSCTWHEGPWSECSNDCGDGQEVRSITCSGPGGDVDCADTKPSASRSCFSAANCAWQVDAWQLCNVSCGIGHQERVVHCPTGNDLDCPESQRPRVLQRCYRQDGCRWLEGAWSACSGICEAGTRSRNVSCLSGDASDCSQVTRPLDQEACNQQAAGCLWSVGPWSSCSALSCGGLGSRVRDVRCPSRHGDAGCAASKPREVEACLSETVCEWRLDTEWSDCDASCGSGLSTRVVSCSAGRDEECPGEKPASSKECYSTTGCQWWTGQWGNCNATCGLGYETRSLVCGAESCDPGSAPVSVRPCRSTMHCEWQIGDWGPCSTACGDGVSARPVACPSGEDADCAFSPRPLDRKECRNVTGCTWSTSSWSVCSQSCGEGTQTRAVLCPSGSAADCGESSKPIALQSCEGRLGCQWQMGDWSSCSTHCGDGTRQRSVRCSGTDVEHCNASTRPLSDEPCSSSACDAWSLGDWSPCSTECGDGVQQRSVQCTEPASCGESPASQQVCFESSGCHWVVGSWSNCSEGCGLGTRSREIRCSGGAQEFCRATRPADRQSCDADSVARSMIGPSCGWTAGAWSACGANCGPQQREVTCSAACFGKAPSALRPCEDAGSACADQGNASARFEVSLLMDDLSTELLTNLVAGTREAVAEMLQVSPADVQVTVVNETSSQTRRLSVRLKLEVEVVSSAGSVAMLSSELGKEMLHTELLETWDEKGLPLEDFSVLVSSVETETEVETTQAPSESAVEQPPAVSNLVVLVIVLCTLLCSAIAGALYCWRWQRTGATVVPQSPKLHPPTSPCPQPQGGGAESLKSPKGGASPAAVSAMRHAASQSDASSKPTLPVEARKVVPEPRTSNAGSEPMTEAVGMTEEANEIKERVRATSLQVRVVQPGEKPSARAVRVTNATVTRSSTAVSSSSRSPLSHAPRPSDGAIDTGTLTQRTSRSEPHRLPLEPMGR